MSMENNKVLVTGASGFVGQYLCSSLWTKGYKVIEHQGKDELDLRNTEETLMYFEEHTPNIVIHLAARVGGIGANQNHPAEFFYDNMLMGLNTIHAAHMCNVDKFVMLSTVCSYPKFTEVPFKESDIWKGYPEETNAPYGIAKKSLMVMLNAYKDQYKMNGITLLPTNLYGPGDNFHLQNSHVIPALIRKVYDARKANAPSITLWGTGTATREFLYVEDCARGIIDAMEEYEEDEPLNLGTGIQISITSLVKIIKDIMTYKGGIIWDASKPDGQPKRCLNVDRAKDIIGFEASTTLRNGLEKTVEWFENTYEKEKAIIAHNPYLRIVEKF